MSTIILKENAQNPRTTFIPSTVNGDVRGNHDREVMILEEFENVHVGVELLRGATVRAFDKGNS